MREVGWQGMGRTVEREGWRERKCLRSPLPFLTLTTLLFVSAAPPPLSTQSIPVQSACMLKGGKDATCTFAGSWGGRLAAARGPGERRDERPPTAPCTNLALPPSSDSHRSPVSPYLLPTQPTMRIYRLFVLLMVALLALLAVARAGEWSGTGAAEWS